MDTYWKDASIINKDYKENKMVKEGVLGHVFGKKRAIREYYDGSETNSTREYSKGKYAKIAKFNLIEDKVLNDLLKKQLEENATLSKSIPIPYKYILFPLGLMLLFFSAKGFWKGANLQVQDYHE